MPPVLRDAVACLLSVGSALVGAALESRRAEIAAHHELQARTLQIQEDRERRAHEITTMILTILSRTGAAPASSAFTTPAEA